MQTLSTVLPHAVLAAAFLLAGTPGGAQERQGAEPKASPPARRFFDRPIDFWQEGLVFEEEKPPGGRGGADERRGLLRTPSSEWGQVIRQPDGTLAYYELPRPLVDVLEDPSPEKIRAYMDWKMGRARKILRAAEAMKEYRSPAAGAGEIARAIGADEKKGDQVSPPPPAPGSEPAPGAKDAAKIAATVTYFHRDGCPHCDSQDAILERWLKDRPEVKLVPIGFGEKSELWRRYQVRGTPTLVILADRSPKPVLLEGLSGEAELARAVRESALALEKKSAQGGKE